MSSLRKMYVLCDSEITYSKPFVQGAHAVAEFAMGYPNEFREWGNATLIFLKCKGKQQLVQAFKMLMRLETIPVVPFFEPDYPGEEMRLAAICYIASDSMVQGVDLM